MFLSSLRNMHVDAPSQNEHSAEPHCLEVKDTPRPSGNELRAAAFTGQLLKMPSSRHRTSHGGLSGKFCSALWSRAATLSTVCGAQITSLRGFPGCSRLSCCCTGKAHILEVLNALYHELAACEVLSAGGRLDRTPNQQSLHGLFIS